MSLRKHWSMNNWFLSDSKCEENRQYNEYFPHKTQKCKGIHSTVQTKIIEIGNLYPTD